MFLNRASTCGKLLATARIAGLLCSVAACGTKVEDLRERLPIKTQESSEDKSFSAVAKASSFQGEMGLVQPNADFVTIMALNQFTPQGHELQMTGSLVSSILTETITKSKGGKRDTSTASAAVQIRFLVDGKPVLVGSTDTITFNQRTQSLSITLQGIIDSCQDSNADGVLIINDECTLLDETVELLLSTTSANSFTVVAKNLTNGNHRIEVQAKITTSTSSQSGSARALATLGVGSLIVNQVREVRK